MITKRIIASVLVAFLFIATLCQPVFAAGTTEFDPPNNILDNPSFDEENGLQSQWKFNEETTVCLNDYIDVTKLFTAHSGAYCAGFLPNDSTCKAGIYQDFFHLPEDQLFEFSGYIATGAGSITIKVGEQSVTLPGNNRVWEKMSILFYGNSDTRITIESSVNEEGIGFWLDDVSLTPCIGTSFEEEDFSLGQLGMAGGILVEDPELALQGNNAIILPSGEELLFEGEELEPGDYELAFYVRLPEGEPLPDLFFQVMMDMIGENSEILVEDLGDSWKRLSMQFTVDYYEYIRFILAQSYVPELFIDSVSLVKMGDASPHEILSNRGFEYNLNNWNQIGSPSAFTTSEQSHSGQQSLTMGYFQSEPMNRYVEQTAYSRRGSFTFSAYVKTHSTFTGTGVVLTVEAKDSSGNVLTSSTSSALSTSDGTWKRISTHLEAPYYTRSVTVKIGGENCIGAFYVDDASLIYQS